MELRLDRTELLEHCTIGKLSINGQFECYTLEDKVRSVKIVGVTAIPSGTYEVVITDSARFGHPMPLLLNVPGFEGVRIHAGNKAEDTEGCILVGDTTGGDSISQSRPAFTRIFSKLKTASVNEKIFLEIG
ncbi:DUF5675 family protein [Nitrosospira sp. Is2]|uniref:DUF5675 family protein n=1 Tax=Nitrosospira sp. Is2 TaxID=3080532 RepID=UPI002954FB76|nr:DUF5675 family protein [Nitrosospira sp. Is2]WON73498.1 DUF5675 family protein [Nitrosospira sp. Is2]